MNEVCEASESKAEGENLEEAGWRQAREIAVNATVDQLEGTREAHENLGR